MNLNGDEKRIRQLYRDLAVDDQRHAPAFASVVARSESRVRSSHEHRSHWKLAFVVASLCLAVLIAVLVFSKPKHLESAQQNLPVPDHETNAIVKPDPGPMIYEPAVAPERKPRHRGQPSRTTLTARSLFAWKSPTASLMRVPEDKLLKSLPRLGESLQTMKLMSPDDFN